MMIEGTVTISLKDFIQLQQEKQREEERAYEAEKKANRIGEEVTALISGFDDEEFNRRIAAIDSTTDMTDAQIRKAFDDAVGTMKVIVDPEKLKKLIRKYVNKKAGNNYEDLKNTEDKVLKQIEIILKSE